MAFAPRGAIPVNQAHRMPGQGFGVFFGICDGRGAAHKLRGRAIVRANSHQTPQYIGDMRAKDAPVSVYFVEHHIAQVLKKTRPAWVVGQHALVQHIGIAQNHPSLFAQCFALVGRRVSIVSAQRKFQLFV